MRLRGSDFDFPTKVGDSRRRKEERKAKKGGFFCFSCLEASVC